jgi:hypothetical protein
MSPLRMVFAVPLSTTEVVAALALLPEEWNATVPLTPLTQVPAGTSAKSKRAIALVSTAVCFT